MAAATMYVTVTGGDPTHDGTTWAKAFSYADFDADLDANAEPGDIYYVQEGTYTLTSSLGSTGRDGTAVAPITIIGVRAEATGEPPTYAEWADGNLAGDEERPIFVCAANAFSVGDYYKIYNICFTGTLAPVVNMGVYGVLYNCKATQNSATADRACFNVSGFAITCEGTGLVGGNVTGTGFSLGAGANCIFCLAHNLNTGYTRTSSPGGHIIFCVAETCLTAGVGFNSRYAGVVMNCTLNDCVVGVSGSTGYCNAFINNIISSSDPQTTTDGFIWTTQTDINFFLQNHQGLRVTDMWDLVEETIVAHKDNAVTSGDPLFDADQNLSLQAASPCVNAGLSAYLGT